MSARGRATWIVANWKMNFAESDSLAPLPALVLGAANLPDSVKLAVAPSFPSLRAVADKLAGTPLTLTAQNVHWEDRGAYTGEVSARMLAELGVRMVLVGHSERRRLFHETDAQTGMKAAACVRHGLVPILCVGETEAERQAARTAEVVARQIAAALDGLGAGPGEFLMAYEPVWAIGSGRNATPAQAQEVHALMRGILGDRLGATCARSTPIVYGGSVTPENARGLLALDDVDGALVGAASLDAGTLLAIAAAA